MNGGGEDSQEPNPEFLLGAMAQYLLIHCLWWIRWYTTTCVLWKNATNYMLGYICKVYQKRRPLCQLHPSTWSSPHPLQAVLWSIRFSMHHTLGPVGSSPPLKVPYPLVNTTPLTPVLESCQGLRVTVSPHFCVLSPPPHPLLHIW